MPPKNSLPARGPHPGRFITVEGMDGAGKSTHIPVIAEHLRRRGHDVLVTREPGGTPLAEKFRGILLSEAMDPATETLLMFAARSDHVARVIRPALEAGRWVVCDRFTDATIAYQGAGKGVSRSFINALAEGAHPGLSPDCTLIFDCPWPTARERLAITGRALDRFEREDQAFFERVRAGYLSLAATEPRRIRLIDASGAPTTVEKLVYEAIVTL